MKGRLKEGNALLQLREERESGEMGLRLLPEREEMSFTLGRPKGDGDKGVAVQFHGVVVLMLCLLLSSFRKGCSSFHGVDAVGLDGVDGYGVGKQGLTLWPRRVCASEISVLLLAFAMPPKYLSCCSYATQVPDQNRFMCNGRLIFGPDARSLIVTLLLVIVPVAIFCTFVASNLFHKFPSYNAGYAILVATIVYTIYVLVLLFLTSARDPGIVPRNAHPPEEEFCYESSASVEAGGRPTPSLQLPRTKELIVNGMPVIKPVIILATTYENFRYRADNRPNVYDRGCLNNFLEVFCTKIETSRNNFRAYVQEEAPRPPRALPREAEVDDSGGSRRAKVEDDLEMGDVLKISQRHDFSDVGDVRSRVSDGLHQKSPDVELGLGLELQAAPGSLSDRHHSSLGRRN
ncbi:hypothetical protein RHSIM_Rhsim10G0145200 [Rhododendron simsii]|uniref:S-acyltransferase n=1 Tax=Rhododendron simsii TaxID=118357 RepID=A0A834GDX3_RHOSS|nr:hypothetical protein RHSIM_Rhsim10G0145200 [Rhododendron simsii]